MTPYEHAVALGAKGIPTFPCNAAKRPLVKRWAEVATTHHTPERWRDADEVGMPTGARSGIDALDIDPRNGGEEWLAANWDGLPLTPTVKTPSGGVHYYFAAKDGRRCSASRIAPGVDVRADGGYVIRRDPDAYPIENDGALAEMPDWLAEAAAGPKAREVALSSSDIEAPSPDAAVAVLDAMPNPESTTRDEYVAVMLAARGCGEHPDITDAAVRWAARWPDSEGEAFEAEKWESDFSMRDAPLAGWRSLLAHATRLGVDVSKWRAADASTVFDAVEPAKAADHPAALPRGKRMLDRLVYPADCATGPRRGYIVKGMIAPGDVGTVVGAPGTGKSQIAPFLAYAVAQGRSVFGLRTKPGRTLYLAGEDMAGMRQRIHALRLQHGDTTELALAECGNLLDVVARADVLATVENLKPALVVLDTVGACFAGMDENGSADMGVVVAFSRTLAATGAAVLLIHHIAKHGDGSPRGHSVLNGTLDMCLSLDGLDEHRIVRGRLTKNRNGPCDIDIAFRSLAVTLGQDEDGDDVTAPIACDLAGAPCTPAKKLPPREARALAVLRTLDPTGGGVPEQAWRDACEDQHICVSDKPENRRKGLLKCLKTLLDCGAVRASSDLLFAVSRDAPASRNEAEWPGTGRNGAEWQAFHSAPDQSAETDDMAAEAPGPFIPMHLIETTFPPVAGRPI